MSLSVAFRLSPVAFETSWMRKGVQARARLFHLDREGSNGEKEEDCHFNAMMFAEYT